MRIKKTLTMILVLSMCLSMWSGITPLKMFSADLEYEVIEGVEADVYYGDFVWGHWYFQWNEDKSRKLNKGKLQSEGNDAILTTGEVYTHGDIVMISFDEDITFKKLELKSDIAGQFPYKFRLEYSSSTLSSPPDIPQPYQTVGEYSGYDMSSDTLTVEFPEVITARTIWLQALTNGEDQEPGLQPWSVSEIRLYKESFHTVPDKPNSLVVKNATENSLSFSWSTQNNNYKLFDIYRSYSEEGVYDKIGSTSSEKYTDSGLFRGTNYYYKIKAVNHLGESEYSEVLFLRTIISVMNLTIDEVDDGNKLTWKPEAGAEDYDIYRASGKYSNYEWVGTSETSSFVDLISEDKYRYYYKIGFTDDNGHKSDLSSDVSLEGKLFGDTLTFFNPSDDSASINAITSETMTKMHQMAVAEFSEERFAFMFKPGTYQIDPINVGYYTTVYGLGATPYDTIVPKIEVPAQGHNSLTNFWRSVENIGIDTGDLNNQVKWAASQAAPARRLYVNGNLHMDEDAKYASGGFLADSYITGATGSYSQQQYFLRNNKFAGSWYGGVWNMLFVGVENSPVESANWAETYYESFSVEKQAPVIREKPFLHLNDKGNYGVFVPGLRHNAEGVSWTKDNPGIGVSIPIDQFHVAKANVDTADTINEALTLGKHLLLTPGIYKVDKPIKVDHANTVVLGIGLATIIPVNGNDAMQVADVGGVTIAGILFDAGEMGSEHLLRVGPEGSSANHSANPTLLADIFTRVGGAVDGKAEVTVEINSRDVIGDHFWLWRADHGKKQGSTGWTKNIGKHGLIVNGENVTIYGLFVEHFQDYQTIWNGENGKTYFYQSEIPYDPPYQADYMSHNGTVKGYSSYKVSDHVKSHYAVALGIYDVFNQTSGWVELENAMEVSDGTKVKHAAIVSLGANGGTNHIVNGVGGPVSGGQAQKKGINFYYKGNGNSEQPPNSTDNGQQPDTTIVINGDEIKAAVTETKMINGKKTTTIMLNEDMLAKRLTMEMHLIIPIAKSDVAIGKLTLPFLKKLAEHHAVIEFRTERAKFVLPAMKIPLEMDQFSVNASPEEVKLKFVIADPSSEIALVTSELESAGRFELLAPVIDFRVLKSYGEREEQISNFTGYVEHFIALPKQAPALLAAGVSMDVDGEMHPVPTKTVIEDGQSYAVLSSLVNSTYAVVSNSIDFSDMAGHWAQVTVNKLGGYFIVKGTDGHKYYPEKKITRAEFSTMLTRALGLRAIGESFTATDVSPADWFYKAMQIGFEKGLLDVEEGEMFRPNEVLTREQAVQMLYKSLKFANVSLVSEQPDDSILESYIDKTDISMRAKSSFVAALRAGIVEGKPDKSLSPQQALTRAEAAILIERLLVSLGFTK